MRVNDVSEVSDVTEAPLVPDRLCADPPRPLYNAAVSARAV